MCIRDSIKIEYAGGGNLYILATQLEQIQKYAGAGAKKPKLNKLGGQEWNKTKSRVRGAVKEIAEDLVKLYAVRQNEQGFAFGPDTVWQKEFEEMFPFEEKMCIRDRVVITAVCRNYPTRGRLRQCRSAEAIEALISHSAT